MKRTLGSSDSLSSLIPICQSEEQSSANKNNNSNSSRGYPPMFDGLDEDDCVEESGHVSEKKRRLSIDQVKALEKNFEVENKLEPERKVRLAQELGLQPRQVAVWFQNRRARWKTKQLERDFGVLKANYDSLKLNFESLQKDKEALLVEVRELKSKLQEEESKESGLSIKEEEEEEEEEEVEVPMRESEYIVSDHSKISSPTTDPSTTTHQDFDNSIKNNSNCAVFVDFKDGSSDSDSSAILNDNNHKWGSSSSSSPSSINCFPISDSKPVLETTHKEFHHYHHHQPHQFVKMEEHNFFSVEETCNFFSDEQAPTLQWCYSTDQWS
ncbi:hypothetical protein Syun_013558 [Stephania yunnanensis]|uniref:Homeobox-leucine zipper protein n=1 Tax=Stephania yunnanensis TaxID=152371 RepID=A0AAP0P7V8_9MAGN